METEKTFFQDKRVTVTNTRCIIDNKTFAMSGITSVGSHTEVPARTGPLVTVIVGIVCLCTWTRTNNVGLFWGLGLIVAGVLWWRSVKDRHYLLISSASGETKLLQNTNEQYISGIVRALNDAIIYRN